MSSVSVDELWVRYGEYDAVRGVSFTVGSGELVVLAGANGAGKTSTLETIEGYRTPTSGSVQVLDQSPASALGSGRVGVMLQDDGIYPAARVGEVVQLFASLHGADDAAADDAIDVVGLDHRRTSTVRRLSGGEHRRLGLALALVGRPEVLLLDEPTAGVDAEGRDRIVDTLVSHCDHGGSVLMTTHELGVAERIADRVVVIDQGVIIADDSVDALTTPEVPGTRFHAKGSFDLASASRALGAEVSAVADDVYFVAAERSASLIATLGSWAAAHQLDLGDIDDNRRDLEQAVAALITGAAGR